MKHSNLPGELKQKLIQQSLRRKLKINSAEERQNPFHATVPTREKKQNGLIDFTHHPGYQQIRIIRDGAAKLGVANPFFRLHEGCAGATTIIGGKSYLNFASYNYLGLSGHPVVNQAAKEAIERYGTSVSASRMVSGERPIHQRLESALAQAYEVDDAVVFVSGHATNVSSIGYLLGSRDLILHDEFIHNSTLEGAKLSGARRIAFAHNDPAALARILQQQRNQFERVLIVLEGIYSMDGDYPELPRFIELKQQFNAWLMVDEAHSLGVMGSHGLGIREHFGLPGNAVDIWMGTLSKTLAACGGYIAGCSALIEILRHLAPGFLYSVGLPAQAAAPALAALNLMLQEPERVARLQHISTYFLQQAKRAGFDTGSSVGLAVVPIITGSSLNATRLSLYLFEQGINVQPILYPAVPEKSARLRFFLSTDHNQEQIDQTLAVLQAAQAAL
ncbi:MAG: aminotransferase class I/II-fold pyridoxal phosphate-dependent enzyme [Gammaproteobacteria bacterium]|nr:aminotransferase class I/II-fold pyridoxal phosphate-dependent enzyme [Gammaproteobacteria bacterium]MCP5415953.1 aminotransferase class I/II-fold pyridoxal phosphate-dependent enzyme [Chromatiaceae bacterium]